MHIFLYGPPMSGKSTLGSQLAARLKLPFLDLDQQIELNANCSITEIFRLEGEPGFRKREFDALSDIVQCEPHVVALGGGALLDKTARSLAENHGQVLCLKADIETLAQRLKYDDTSRPLLSGNSLSMLRNLLDMRDAHYNSFLLKLDTGYGSIDDLTTQAQLLLGVFRVVGMGNAYDVCVAPGGLLNLGQRLREKQFKGPVAIISDEQVFGIHGKALESSINQSGYDESSFCFPPGEESKTIQTIVRIWDHFTSVGIERGSTVIALGGGVVGDMAGFAAATYLRGVAWVNIPTSLLAMVDSSLGGKTGIDLPQAKNLIGAFYPPRYVFTDPGLLNSLPDRELSSGLAEVVKHAIIGDPDLFTLCSLGKKSATKNLETIVRRGMMVKMKVIEEDPFEKGARQALNFGHTIGHGIEIASGFHLSHGEAVSIGMVYEARIAEDIGLAETGITANISQTLNSLGLPVQIPRSLDIVRVIQAMRLDKKRSDGHIHFALPVRIGDVRTGVVLKDWDTRLMQLMRSSK